MSIIQTNYYDKATLPNTIQNIYFPHPHTKMSNYKIVLTMLSDKLNKYRGMSWAEMTYIEDEEDSREKAIALRQLVATRQELFAKGQYDLEDGEIIE